MARVFALLGVVAATVVVGLALGVLLQGDGKNAAVPAALPTDQSTLRVVASTEPGVQSFGEPIVAKVEVSFNASVVDPDRIRPEQDFSPYERAGAPTVERVNAGKTARITFSYPLRCLGEGCEPTKLSGVLVFPQGRVRYFFNSDPSGRGSYSTIDWPGFTVTGRVSDQSVADIAWRADRSELAAITYRSEPRTLAILALALATTLAAGAAILAWLLWGRRRETDRLVDDESRTPLSLLLEAARVSALNGDLPRRRRALESVARELGRVGFADLAADARTLAWSPRDATSADVEELARRSELEGAR